MDNSTKNKLTILGVIVLFIVVISLIIYFSNSSTRESLEIFIKGSTGKELFEIQSLEKKILLGETIATTDVMKISLNPNIKSFIINFKNDQTKYDIYIIKIIKNGKELKLKDHIRADLKFPIENPRYNTLLEGKLLWGGEYRIDL
jgi:hypothetical protein